MGTADPERSRGWVRWIRWIRWIGPAVVIAIALVVVIVLAGRGPEPSTAATGGPGGTTAGSAGGPMGDRDPAPVAVAATDTLTYPDLASLARASDVVVRGHVTRVQRGRVVGDPTAGDAIVSKIVTVTVDSSLRGSLATGASVLVEEEGWLVDGSPILVNGVTPPAEGDEAVWFLQAVTDPELTGYIQTNGQGRYQILPDGSLRGAAPADPLVHATQLAGLPTLLTQTMGA